MNSQATHSKSAVPTSFIEKKLRISPDGEDRHHGGKCAKSDGKGYWYYCDYSLHSRWAPKDTQVTQQSNSGYRQLLRIDF